MMVPVEHSLASASHLDFQPITECRMLKEMAALLMIRDDEKGSARDARTFQFAQDLPAPLPSMRRDVVQGDDQCPLHGHGTGGSSRRHERWLRCRALGVFVNCSHPERSVGGKTGVA